MLDREVYGYFVRELLKRKTQPYRMSNEPVAIECFNAFRQEHPDASIHFYGTFQYVCMDNRARKNLIKRLRRQRQMLERALQGTMDLITEVESECV